MTVEAVELHDRPWAAAGTRGRRDVHRERRAGPLPRRRVAPAAAAPRRAPARPRDGRRHAARRPAGRGLAPGAVARADRQRSRPRLGRARPAELRRAVGVHGPGPARVAPRHARARRRSGDGRHARRGGRRRRRRGLHLALDRRAGRPAPRPRRRARTIGGPPRGPRTGPASASRSSCRAPWTGSTGSVAARARPTRTPARPRTRAGSRAPSTRSRSGPSGPRSRAPGRGCAGPASAPTAAARRSTIAAEPAIALTVRPWSTEALAAVDHDHLLRGDGRTHVVLDLAQSGVGTAACGPGPLPPYRLTARRVQGSLLFTPTATTTEEHR